VGQFALESAVNRRGWEGGSAHLFQPSVATTIKLQPPWMLVNQEQFADADARKNSTSHNCDRDG
jgi:hypothetical protein